MSKRAGLIILLVCIVASVLLAWALRAPSAVPGGVAPPPPRSERPTEGTPSAQAKPVSRAQTPSFASILCKRVGV